ncbi:hypothetical protein CLU79DRAFT_686550, partial [Phycomyces nitens]
SIIQLMGKLPCNPVSDDTNESKLGSQSIDQFLCGLFDYLDHDMYLRWTNEITLEAKNRPEICITSLYGSRFSTNHGFGDINWTFILHNQPTMCHNNFLLCSDLLRVATFCKDALDAHNMEGVLVIQANGRVIYFYILLLSVNGVYVFHD